MCLHIIDCDINIVALFAVNLLNYLYNTNQVPCRGGDANCA